MKTIEKCRFFIDFLAHPNLTHLKVGNCPPCPIAAYAQIRCIKTLKYVYVCVGIFPFHFHALLI